VAKLPHGCGFEAISLAGFRRPQLADAPVTDSQPVFVVAARELDDVALGWVGDEASASVTRR